MQRTSKVSNISGELTYRVACWTAARG